MINFCLKKYSLMAHKICPLRRLDVKERGTVCTNGKWALKPRSCEFRAHFSLVPIIIILDL